MDPKQKAGAWLIGAALVLVVIAGSWWLWETSQEDERQTRANADAAFGLAPPKDVEPNAAGPIAMGAVAAVLFLSGVVLVAVSSPPRRPDASDRP